MKLHQSLNELNYSNAGPPAISSRAKILLVDDLQDNLLALEGLLRRDDVEIFCAQSGMEALELMIRHEFSLALIDVKMPIMSGFELAELMRGTKNTKSIPIIFVTATAKEQKFSFKGYESGAVDFLPKPLDTHSVKSKVSIFIELYRQKKELSNQLDIITRSEKEQAVLLKKLKSVQVELEQALNKRDEFTSIASHELKTPLTSLMLQAQLRKINLGKGNSSAFTIERLTKMFAADERLLLRITHLIDDMLDVSRIGSGKLTMKFETFDLCVLVTDLVERNRELFAAASCEVDFKVCESAIGLWDKFRIEQVIMNLLTNAIRYGAGKPILLNVSLLGDTAIVTVRDNGRGISKENHARIFQKFERGVSNDEVSGLGLGLYIVTQILEAHHGLIRVDSELGQGSTFIVELPLNASKC